MTVKEVGERIREIARERASKLTVTAILVLIVVGIPNAFGYAEFWWSVGTLGLPKLLGIIQNPWGRTVLIVIGLGAIWLDQIRITHRLHGGKKHDLQTLSGRALHLRDEMQKFMESVEPLPEPKALPGEERSAYLKRTWTIVGRRVNKLGHGFELRFSEPAERLHHEFGELGIRDSKMAHALNEPFKTEDSYKEIMEGLVRMTKRMDNEHDVVTWYDVDTMTADALGERIKNDAQFQNDIDMLPPRKAFRQQPWK